ncbi:LOW QUALITY PROTEIN: mucin-4-like [Lampris incognitus]|uniref:LOW QUALITY PROTEIN: mucin-4-like n=1 Tax=Lampris incognitus TaxID=2546036 RepID=UPI0024B50093|nr:LOW QUALITY PROTEIN: mucin-4-like [Lampris incognitus]
MQPPPARAKSAEVPEDTPINERLGLPLLWLPPSSVMSLSQTKCLEDGHVNPRTHESKTEFFYCEDQRLALEALLRDGREGVRQVPAGRAVRGFLSEPEQEVLTAAVERYDPGSELRQREDADDAESLSLHYWPDVSDVSVPDLDLGWPDCAAYRGVTRVNVYAQPPLDGQAHIKEVVRKAIAQAQKVIAVVMDAFTDVDIFRDLLDASFKRRVSVYILLERTALTHFLSMCERANMHAGHLKNLRVRCMGGAEFYTRSCTRVRGRLGHRFIFVDGDKAVSGSYSFTWMSSRLDRHLITVVTGQAVETFDRVFRDLYATSSAVNLQRIATEPEPEPEPLPQPAPLALPSAAVARKLYNPKYALLAIGTKSPSPTSSSGHNSPKDSNSQNPPLPQSNRRRRRVNKEATVEEAPPLHPGLLNLERAYLIPYLPTWPEPDPPSDVIGFINVRDASRPTQVHLQRSERFETSQAIRFSSPISMPEKVLPVIAQPRQIAAKKESSARCKVEPTPGDTKPEETMPDKMKPGQLDARPSSTDPKRSEQGEHATGPKTQTADLKLVTTETPSHTLKSEPKMMTTEKPDTPAVNNGRYLSSETPVNSVLTSPISTPPITKPRTILLVIKAGDGDPDTEEVTVMRRAQSHPSTALVMERIMGVCDTQSGPDSVPCFEKETEAVLELHNKSGMKTGVLDEDTNWGKPRDEHSVTKQSGTQTETQETCEPETERESDCWSRKGAQVLPETKMQAQSDNFLTNAPQMDNMTPKNIPTTPQLQPGNDSKLPQQNESSTAPNETSENVTQSKYIPMASVFHPSTAGPLPAISLTSKTNTHSSVSDVHTHKHDPILANHIYKQGVDDDDVQESGPAEAENVLPTHSQQGVMTHCTNDRTARTPQSVLNTAEESQQPKANGSSHTPKKDLCLHFSDSAPLALEVPSLTPDRDTRSHTPVFRTPDPDLRTNTPDPRSYTPDFRTPDPDLRTNTPDPRSYTPDFRTPTPDVSDGCISPRDDSTLSTTSEEYYECSESPFSESAIERLASRGQRTTENFPATQPSSGAAKASTRATSSMSGTSDSSDSCGLSLTSSTPQTRQKTRNDGNQGNRREECEENTGYSNKHSASPLATTIPFSIPTPRNTRLPVATLSVPADAWDRKDPEGVEREQSCHKVEMSPVGPVYRCVMDDVQETPGELSSKRELASKESEPKRLSADEFKTGKFPTKERKSKDLPSKGETLKECFTRGERVAETQARGPSGAEKKGRPLAFTKTEVKKAVQAPPRSPSWQQQVGCAALQAPPSRPSRPYPAPQPPGGINQVGSKLIHSSLQALENNRTLSRLIPAYGAAGVAAAGPKRSQGGSSPGRHSSPYRQPPTEQGRARAGRSRSQPPYTQASFLYTQPNIQNPLQLQTQLYSSQNQAARQGSALGSRTITGAVGHEHGKTSLSLSFGRLYNIKGLKEKVSKPSLQSKRSSTTSPPQGHKSTG